MYKKNRIKEMIDNVRIPTMPITIPI